MVRTTSPPWEYPTTSSWSAPVTSSTRRANVATSAAEVRIGPMPPYPNRAPYSSAYTHRPAARRAGASVPKLDLGVDRVPCSNRTGGSAERQLGSLTPARPTEGRDVPGVPAVEVELPVGPGLAVRVVLGLVGVGVLVGTGVDVLGEVEVLAEAEMLVEADVDGEVLVD